MTRKQTQSVSQQPPAALVVDADATVASATQPVEQVFGYSPSELVDAPIETVVEDSVPAPVGNGPPAGNRRATGATRARCRHASGTEFTARLAWAPLGSAPRLVVTVEDAFVAREERYDAALRSAARSLLRATTWDGAATAIVDAAGAVASIDDAVLYVAGEAADATETVDPAELAERLTPVASHAGDPAALDADGTATARDALGTDSVARRDRDDGTDLFVPVGDRALLRLAVDQDPAVGCVTSFAGDLADHGAAALSRLAATGSGGLAGDDTTTDAPTTAAGGAAGGDGSAADAGSAADGDGSLARRNAELRRRVDRLERRNEELQEFTDVVAHDLRNPLNAAQACVELAEHDEGDVSGHLADLERAHERMRDLIDDLLTLTRNGEAVGETRPVPLAAVTDDAWTTVGTEYPDDPALDVADGVPRVEADEERLRTLLENLFGNAIDHAGPDVTVRVGPLRDGFYVADDGPGIPPGERERVFEHGYSTHSNGTGYGLAIVEGIASGHGWEVAVTESAEGGARFEFHGVDRAAPGGSSDGTEGTDD